MTEAPLPKIEDFIIISDKNNKYSIQIYSHSNSYLNIYIKTIDKFPNMIFEDKFSLDTIKNNKYFYICENISQVLITLEPILKNKDNIKLLEETNELNLIINIPHPLCPEIIFKVKEKKRDLNESINELYEIINKQNIQINEKNNQINLLNQTIDDLKKLINDQNNKIKNLEDKFTKLEEENKQVLEIKKEEEKIKNEYLSQNSKIIKNDNEKEQTIKEWINPNKKIKFTLLYRMSRDGENATDFHRNCDNKGATLTLAETTKGYQIGGYTTLDWESDNSGKDKTDDLTFLFSLNQMKKYTKKNNSRSIYVHKDNGPGFGYGKDLGIGNPQMTIGWSYNSTFLTNRELTNGEENFTYKEVEVYKVDFN